MISPMTLIAIDKTMPDSTVENLLKIVTDLPSILNLALAAFAIAICWYLFRPRRTRSRGIRKSFAATENQMRYLAQLVSEQNFFRAKSLTLAEWLEKKGRRPGFISFKMASGYIQTLKSENQQLQSEFEQLKNREGVGQFRGEIYVSDLRALAFCEMSAHFSSHQYPNQNLIDLSAGHSIHRAFAENGHQNPKKPRPVTDFIKKQESSVSRVEWISNESGESLRHPSQPLTGRPDGFVHYLDGSRAVIELKTVASLNGTPRSADFDQADLYALLAKNLSDVRDDSLVLYTERSTRRLSLHKRKRRLTEYDLAQMVARVEIGARSAHDLRAGSSPAQCASCGYRSICSRKLLA